MSGSGIIVIAQTKNDAAPPPLPAPFAHKLRVMADEQVFDCYAFEPQ
jgi:hypothetical protein